MGEANPVMGAMARGDTVAQMVRDDSSITANVTELNLLDGRLALESQVQFAMQNFASNTTYAPGTATFVPIAGLAEGDGFVAPRAGSVTSVTIRLGTASADGEAMAVCPFKYTANGTATALNSTLTLGATVRSAYTAYTPGTLTFNAGDVIGPRVKTNTTIVATHDAFIALGLTF